MLCRFAEISCVIVIITVVDCVQTYFKLLYTFEKLFSDPTKYLFLFVY